MDAIPGIARSRASTMKRSFGTIETRRSRRSTRSTENGPVPGISAMPTTKKSNTCQGLRQKRRP
jgi:hypothetical protein